MITQPDSVRSRAIRALHDPAFLGFANDPKVAVVVYDGEFVTPDRLATNRNLKGKPEGIILNSLSEDNKGILSSHELGIILRDQGFSPKGVSSYVNRLKNNLQYPGLIATSQFYGYSIGFRSIGLSPTEMYALYLLHQNKGEITKPELSEQIFGSDNMFDLRNLRVVITRLNSRLSKIETRNARVSPINVLGTYHMRSELLDWERPAGIYKLSLST